jgi:5'(3')-deoxyribonucleotidase
MRLTIGFDLDGVVVDSPQQVVNFVNERLRLNLCMDDFKTYSMEDALPDQYKWIIDTAFKSADMWKKVGLIDGAYDTIKKLWEEGYEIYFITASLPENLRKKINHLSRNLHFFPKDYVWQHTINTQCKQIIKLDVLVDDGLFNLLGDREYVSICVDMPYNQTSEYIPNFYRAYNWDDIYCKIKMIESLIKENKDDDVTS